MSETPTDATEDNGGGAERSTRRRIVESLRKGGEATARQLASAIGITPMGVRRHLSAMERTGLVTHTVHHQPVGRPTYWYQLTRRARDLFPRVYPALLNELLGLIKERDGDRSVTDLFNRRRTMRVSEARKRLDGLDLAEQVRELAQMLDSEGYLAEFEQVDADTFWLREYNCALEEVAARHRQVCASEIQFVREVLDSAEVSLASYMLRGDSHCGYMIRRRTPLAATATA